VKKTSGLNQADSARLRTAIDDIPEALRDTPIETVSASPSPLSRLLAALAIFFGISALGLVATIAWMWLAPATPSRDPIVRALSPAEPEPNATPPSDRRDTSRAAEGGDLAESSDPAAESPDLLGHLPYEEAPPDDLEPITSDGYWELRSAAARSFLEMQSAAQADGVELSVISAYRTIEDQQFLFFDIKAQRGQVASERAEVSAPPGYSEHHTGYAIDLGDANESDANLSEAFEQTAAFAWLADNAAYFSFELSFPRDNDRGIAYEPWHWRFVGDRDSLETFYQARTGEAAADDLPDRESGKTTRGDRD